jgi:Trk K+ transport system NAD-binding subunit
MMILRSLLVLSLALSLTGSTAEAAKGKKKKEHAHKGVVESVKLDNDKGKEMTIKVHAKKKKGVEAKEEKFKLASDTKVERITGKKGSKTTETASLSTLKTGDHVLVMAKDGEAKEIKIVAKKKGKKKNA